MKFRKLYKILRAVVLSIVALAIAVPAVTYMALSLPWVQNLIRVECEALLSEKTGAEVSIGDLGIRPFGRATLRRVAVVNDGDTLMRVDHLSAGINVTELIVHQNVVVDFAEVTGLDLRLRRASAGAPLNIQPIIDALSQKEDGKGHSKFDLRVNTVVIRKGMLSYDVDDEPTVAGAFDPNHAAVSNLRADVSIPRLSDSAIKINLRRLAFAERSGMEITDFHADLEYSPEGFGWQKMVIEMPGTRIMPADFHESVRSVGNIAMGLSDRKLKFGLLPGSYISTEDVAPLYPPLRDYDATLDVNADIDANLNVINLNELSITDRGGQFSVGVADATVREPLKKERLGYSVNDIHLKIGSGLYSQLASSQMPALSRMNFPGGIDLSGSAKGNALAGRMSLTSNLDDGVMQVSATYRRADTESPLSVKFKADAERIDLNEMLGRSDLGTLNGNVKGEMTLLGSRTKGYVDAELTGFAYRRNTYDAIAAHVDIDRGNFSGKASMYDDSGNVEAQFKGNITPGNESVTITAEFDDLDLYGLNLTDKYEGYRLDGELTANFNGRLPDNADGQFTVSGIRFTGADGRSFNLDNLTLVSEAKNQPRRLEIASDFINGSLEGDFEFATLGADLRAIAMRAFPALNGYADAAAPFFPAVMSNDFDFSLSIDDTERLAEFFNLPVSGIYPVTIEGNVNGSTNQATLTIDAPYLRQGNKLIEDTHLTALLDGNAATDRVLLTTSIPSKDGMNAITMAMKAADNTVDTDISWKIDRKRDYSGAISLSTLLDRSNGELDTYTDLHRSTMTFNDSAWIIQPATIVTRGMREVIVDDLCVESYNQFVKINGKASDNPDDNIAIDVLNIDLAYIFDALNIDKVKLGGIATGELTASSLLTPAPHLSTEGIHVTDIGYNGCVLGDAEVLSWWDNDLRAVAIDGTIHQPNGKIAKVEGEIFPMESSLDIRLKANDTPVGFMEEYMNAFASDISGRGTGSARLYGTFSDIDMTGNLYVDDLRLKLNFTNTYFTASDSIKITPGRIALDDVTLHDPYGHTAKLNGWVTHEYFRTPSFKFEISDARNMLVYDETAKQNSDWYGRIFVNGGAKIAGVPGKVNIDVEASTTAGSTFTFVLSELEVADEYTFLTFRDKDAPRVEETVKIDERMGAVEHLRKLMQKPADESTSDYEIELRVNITPEAEVILVMDPVAGDRIRSHGQGNMRMVYTSADNDLRMYGTYTLDKGTYNFTLQDIIIKDFIINQGSQIAFTGDPLTARLNIEAIYQTNANLSDLDESFLQDKELNRTNVPVQALLKVTGDIQQPEINFDLAFPTLTSDTYRKVRSIVSTEEMMNRQIIYLLALNRFYTPDYMTSTTKGNELFSVASSTISSQLSNILGHLSDNWTVAPNFRSDRGGFSDMEVDVALSSRLLNNRLLLNGNFGYRDDAMNSNQFIGDFQIEYLLNRQGSIRLKAYNFYNDQNYYLRTADTTQGVGVMFKKDFDNIFSFLNKLRRKHAAVSDTTAAATPGIQPAQFTDSVAADSVETDGLIQFR